LVKSLNGAHEVIFKYAERFLQTKEGQKWFEDKISNHIFPHTYPYRSEYAEGIASGQLWGRQIGSQEEAIKVAEKLTRTDLLNFLRKNLQKSPPHIWLVSAEKEKDMYRSLERSKLHKYWSSRIPKKLKK
jgi:hypothetical protein